MLYGLDIGGTKIELSIFDEQLNLQQSWRRPTPTSNYADFLATVCSQVQIADEFLSRQSSWQSTQHPFDQTPANPLRSDKLLPHQAHSAPVRLSQLLSHKAHCGIDFNLKVPLGVGLTGVQSVDGILRSSNLPYLNQRAVQLDLQKRLQRPITLGNDCRLFTLAEARVGIAKGYSRVLGVMLGTGAAGGFCLNGQLVAGQQGLAGELGHQPVAARIIAKYQLPLWRCGCGLLGCNESYMSGSGLGRLYQHFGGAIACCHQWHLAFQANETAALQAFNCFQDALASALATQVLAYEPEIIVIGGGLVGIAELLTNLPSALSLHLFTGVKIPQIECSRLGASSVCIGAAIAAWAELAQD